MPIYEYRCSACGELIEVMQKINDPRPALCASCGEKDTMERQVSRTSFQLKGGGWYSDLYGSTKKDAGGKGAPAGKDAPAKDAGASKGDAAKSTTPAAAPSSSGSAASSGGSASTSSTPSGSGGSSGGGTKGGGGSTP